jgi:hypothetical protein
MTIQGNLWSGVGKYRPRYLLIVFGHPPNPKKKWRKDQRSEAPPSTHLTLETPPEKAPQRLHNQLKELKAI